MSYQITAGNIILKLRSDRNAAARFVNDPAKVWVELGGQIPTGVSSSQFAQGIRSGEIFKDIKATAEGKSHANMAWSPCVMAVMFAFNALGLTAAVAVTAASGGDGAGLLATAAAMMGMEVSALAGAITAAGQAPIAKIAAVICLGR